MTIYRSDTVRNALMNALDAVRGQNVKIHIRTLAPSGSGGVGTLLAELIGNATNWAGDSVAGVITSNSISPELNAVDDGTAGHYELLTDGSVWLESGVIDVGGTDGVTIDNTSIASGQQVSMNGDWKNTAAYDDQV